MRRFLAYGLFGLGTEVAFTSISRALRLRDRRLAGETYLWMLPIYGAGGLLLERLHARLSRRGVRAPVRALAATAGIYAMEYGSGAVLRRTIGACPWHYRRGLTVGGYVRLDYAPFWYAAALLFEVLEHEVAKLDRARRGIDRRKPISRERPAEVQKRPSAFTEQRRGARRVLDLRPRSIDVSAPGHGPVPANPAPTANDDEQRLAPAPVRG